MTLSYPLTADVSTAIQVRQGGELQQEQPLVIPVDWTFTSVKELRNNILVTKPSAPIALTLPTPVLGDDNGVVLNIVCTTAEAHVITSVFNDGTTLTAGGLAVGASVSLVAYEGAWWIIGDERDFTLA